MEQKGTMEKRQSVKNLYDKDTGLPIMINLYVIKYIYYHIKKAECFIDEWEAGKKPKAYTIYQRYLPVSRTRFDRINKGTSFEFTAKEADFITEQFGIDMKYFRKGNPVQFEIEGIDYTDWKCFYKNKYGVQYEMSIRKEAIKARADKVESILKKLSGDGWEKTLDRDTPLFAICYFFHYGRRYDTPNNIKIITETLKRTGYEEWDSESIEVLKEISALLKHHYSYINSLLTLDKLRSKK